MKKLLPLFLFVFGSQILSAHPGVENHTHETVFAEWAWLILPIIALIILGRYYTKRLANKI